MGPASGQEEVVIVRSPIDGVNIDAPPDAPNQLEIDVEFSDGRPAPDIDVAFHDATGLPLETMQSDADGKVTTRMPDVAMVTVLGHDPITGRRNHQTVTGVKIGDLIEARLCGAAATPPFSRAISP